MSLALPTEISHYVGVDWGTEHHAVCVLRGDGRVAARFRITHSLDGFRQLHNRLDVFGDPAEVPVGIERPDGRLVDALLEAGHPGRPGQATPDQAMAGRRGALRRQERCR